MGIPAPLSLALRSTLLACTTPGVEYRAQHLSCRCQLTYRILYFHSRNGMIQRGIATYRHSCIGTVAVNNNDAHRCPSFPPPLSGLWPLLLLLLFFLFFSLFFSPFKYIFLSLPPYSWHQLSVWFLSCRWILLPLIFVFPLTPPPRYCQQSHYHVGPNSFPAALPRPEAGNVSTSFIALVHPNLPS